MPDVPNPHDALFRWTFSHLEDARALLKSQLPRSIAARVDWQSLELVSGSFVDEALKGRQAALSRARALPPEGIALELVRWLALARTVAQAPSGLHKLRALLQYLVEASEVDEPTLAGFSQAITAPEEDHAMPTLAEKWKAEGLERGRAEGRANLVLRLLRVKFGDLPAEIVERVRAASPEQIDGWSEALLTAPTLAALFGD